MANTADLLTDNLKNPITDIVTSWVPVDSVTPDSSIAFKLKGQDETIYATPVGTVDAATIVFPDEYSSRIGQNITISSTGIVTALTVTSTGLTLKGTAVTALAANTPISWRKVAALTWLRML